jgi:predicted RNase H-like HicB family nuclease
MIPRAKWVVGEVIELPGCYTEAPDLAALEVAMREAVELYLETINATDG